MRYVPSRKAAEILGVHPNTLRHWEAQGKIDVIRTVGGQRLYNVNAFIGKSTEGRRNYCYCRVSSRKQIDDLNRQASSMERKYPNHEIIKDIGSGLNFKRPGLKTLLDDCYKGFVGEVVVAHRDRLCRFGFDIFKHAIESNGGKLVVLDEATSSPEQELVQDLLSILHVFSCRMHGLRSYSKKIKEDKDLLGQVADADIPKMD